MRELKYYRIDFDETCVRKIESIIIEDITAQKSAPINIEYSVSCDKNNVLSFVTALKGTPLPTTRIRLSINS